MAHIRKDSIKPSTTISWDPEILELVEDYWYDNRKGNRSAGVNELVQFGLRYVELIEKKRAKKKLEKVPV